jgi:hypothetical protein
MKLFLISQQFEGNGDEVFSSLEKAREYINADEWRIKTHYIVEVELDNPDGEVIYHDDNEIIIYRA